MAKKSLPQRGDSRKSIDDMNLQEIQAYNRELLTKLNRLLRERAKKQWDFTNPKPVEQMGDEERKAYQDHLMRRISAHIDTMKPVAPEPTPQPIVEESPAYHLPTKRMKKAVERFDGMTDSEQVDSLRAMW